ncbi:hypothetical protein F4779DRAFT_623497 [Xylariaceae sp. FL0662B]|nr:hypothetical protein F4779DRAFT_623497 [Xylariaceae sp. FL0662B]
MVLLTSSNTAKYRQEELTQDDQSVEVENQHGSPLTNGTWRIMAPSTLASVASAAYCAGFPTGGFIEWRIDIANDAEYNEQCEQGCLDNIRARCPGISQWECHRNPDGGAHLGFITGSGCNSDDVAPAMGACTDYEQDIKCEG